MKKIALLSFAVISTFTSCSDDDNNTSLDTEKPIIVINSPSANQVLHTGEEIHIEATFTDNVALASYKVDIHFGGDGHEHKALQHDHAEWRYQTTGDLSGESDEIHLHLNIPENAEEGTYHLGVYAIDRAGNENVSWITLDLQSHDH